MSSLSKEENNHKPKRLPMITKQKLTFLIYELLIMGESFDMNDMITMNRNIYGSGQQVSKQLTNPADDSSITIDNILMQNKTFYAPVQISGTIPVKEEQQEESIDENQKDFFIELLKKVKVPEIQELRNLYNYNTIFNGEDLHTEQIKQLDIVRLHRKEREQKASGGSVPNQQIKKKQITRIYKNRISKLLFREPKELKLLSKHLANGIKYEKQLALTEFGGKRPSYSIVQEKVNGRFYIYNNKEGIVHIYSSDILINKDDKSLIQLDLNEERPRQDPTLYLIECEHEGQLKTLLFVIGGNHLINDQKKPLKTIKVFEIKRLEVSLTPVLTITMTKPRMNPIVFDLVKGKGIYWQDKDFGEKGDAQKQIVDNKYIFIMGGNPLLDYEKQLDQELIEANTTCEYLSLKRVLEHCARAKMFLQTEKQNFGLDFSKFQMNDTLIVLYENIIVSDKLYNHFYKASAVKIAEEGELLQSKQVIIVGGNTQKVLQLQAISNNEISFVRLNQLTSTPSLINSSDNIKYFDKRLHYFDDTTKFDTISLDLFQKVKPSAQSCTCLIM